MKYIWNDLARNETHFIRFALSFSFHNNTRQCPKSCAGTCLYFIIKVVDTSDPAIFTNHSITECIFTVRQEYNNYNNGDKGITDPTGFKEVREYLKRVQVIVDAQKQGTADIAAALADVKPKVRVLISPPDLIFDFSLCTYTSSTSMLARPSNPRPSSMTRTMMKSKLSEAMWMSLWVRPMDPLLPCLVLILCVSRLIIQVSLLHSTTHFLRWPLTTFSMAKLKSRPQGQRQEMSLDQGKPCDINTPLSFQDYQCSLIIFRLPSNVLKQSVFPMPLSQAWILKAVFITRLPLSRTASLPLPATSVLVPSPLSLMG